MTKAVMFLGHRQHQLTRYSLSMSTLERKVRFIQFTKFLKTYPRWKQSRKNQQKKRPSQHKNKLIQHNKGPNQQQVIQVLLAILHQMNHTKLQMEALQVVNSTLGQVDLSLTMTFQGTITFQTSDI